MVRFSLSTPGDVAGLAARWRALEAAADGSFFQSWNWVGALAAERFADPVLLAAEAGSETLGLALFNRRRSWRGSVLWLNESGAAGPDNVYVEFNGPLLRRGSEGLAGACLAAALAAPIGRRRGMGRRVRLSGADAAMAAAAADLPGRVLRRQPAPWVDFAALPGRDFLASLSANARYQLRRAMRRHAAAGALALHRANTVDEAFGFLDALAALHQAGWTRRGKPGAFADPFFRRFHRAVIAAALPRGEAELLHVTAGAETLGYLYNFRWRGRVHAYQSGFADSTGDAQRKPGLVCHLMAIEAALADGMAGYDFLAGDDRYKTSLANASQELYWLELGPGWSGRAIHPAVTMR